MSEDSTARGKKLIHDITGKLTANEAIVGHASHGQLTWRWTKGKLHIEIRPIL